MASLSDQIDRLTQSTRAIKATLTTTHDNSTGIFTRAVLDTHLGDLIREVDSTELGLFSLVNNHYEQEHQLHRIQFSGATPLRGQSKHDVDTEIYAHAALKCIRQYQPIRPMPRAYDQIVAILDRFKVVRDNLSTLNANLQQTVVNDDVPLAKSRIEQEECLIKELQNRMEELAKRKEIALKIQRETSDQQSPEIHSVVLPSQEEKFWTTPIGPSRTLRFTDNLMDELVDLGDISTASFQTPVPMHPTTKIRRLGSLALFDAPSMTNITPEKDNDREDDLNNEQEDERKDLESIPEVDPPATPTITPHFDGKDTGRKPRNQTTETPSSRQGMIRVNIEVERIMTKIWSTMRDIVMPSGHLKSKCGSLSTNEIIAHLQQLAMQSLRPESPVASSVSSTSIEGNLPTFQQILTAHLLMMLLSAPPHYSMSLNKVKDSLTAKVKEGGASGVGQSTTRVLYGCVAKRLVKIDRGGGEQIVKFDI